jgi:flagellin FlaB
MDSRAEGGRIERNHSDQCPQRVNTQTKPKQQKEMKEMKTQLNKFWKDESGVTALETAIILIAFVVVAAVFAFTILSTGTFLTERSKEAAYSGLQEVRGSMELKGGVVLESTGAYVTFNLANVAGGSSVDLSKVKMSYIDKATNQDIAYLAGTTDPGSNQWIVTDTAGAAIPNAILTTGVLAHVKVKPPANSVNQPNWTFMLEIKPPSGAILTIQRTTPAAIDQVTNLN